MIDLNCCVYTSIVPEFDRRSSKMRVRAARVG